jgi:hypothetical protein
MMPSGEYYIGDLCYVMHEEWDEVCSLFFKGNTNGGCNQGEFVLKDGRRFAGYNTKWGDGEYRDQFNNRYLVDSGCIGCILVSDIVEMDKRNIELGNVIKMTKEFDTSNIDGLISFSNISIETNDVDSYA